MSAVTSTETKANANRFRKTLRNWQLYDVAFPINEDGKLVVQNGDCFIFGSPRALKLAELPQPEDYPNDEAWERAEFEEFAERGREGFDQLLKELSAALEEPLLIVSISWTDHGGEAEAWRVAPGATVVESTSVEVATAASEFLGVLSDEECWHNWKHAKDIIKTEPPKSSEATK